MKKLLSLVICICLVFSMSVSLASAEESGLPESSDKTAGIPNPWMDMTKEELEQVSGLKLDMPDGAEEIACRWLESEGLAEMQFQLNGDSYCARVKPASLEEGQLEDISGMYYSWTHEEDITVGHCYGKLSQAQTGSGEWVELCQWYDAAPGLMYSLSVTVKGDPDGLDLPAVAQMVYVPMQGDAEPDNSMDIQYVMYLGTNDKDTNTPVFTQAEVLERAKDILIRHFGGYTIQEAHGGWISDGKEYQEYTLVIYLSDTSLDAVHFAADEMIDVFHQSSILIQQNLTRTEFYSPA